MHFSQGSTDERPFIQKHSAGLTAVTEKSLASKAGHLEMLHGGKKDKLKEMAAKKAKAGK